jgi:hypothetical protein
MGNALALNDPQLTSAEKVIRGVQGLHMDLPSPPRRRTYASRHNVVEERIGKHHRARIPVHGLDRDSGMSRRHVERLESAHGVRRDADSLSGCVLVDYDKKRVHLEDLVAEVAHLELPVLPQ